MLISLFLVVTLFACGDVFAMGDPIVVLTLAGEFSILGITFLYIVAAKEKWRRKIEAIIVIAIGGGVLAMIYNIPYYEKYAEWIDGRTFVVVMVFVVLSLFILRNGVAALWKLRTKRDEARSDIRLH